jgi:hypothetical protein
MAIFPNLNESFYTDDDKYLLDWAEDMYNKNITISQSNWAEQDIDLRFACGDQTVLADVYGSGAAPFRRRQFSFNRVQRMINMVCGYQKQHRKSTMVTPVHVQDQQTADQMTKLLYYTNSHGNVLETISESFETSTIQGMGLLSTWIDYRKDCVNGEIVVDALAPAGVLLDSFCRKRDFSDCNMIWTRKYVSKKQLKTLLPGREKDLDLIRGSGGRDGKFMFQTESFNYGYQDLYIYDEIWRLDTRKQQMLVDTTTGECSEWRGKDADLRDFLQFYPQVILIDQEIPTVKLAIVVQGKVMYNGENPLHLDVYPFVPIWAYYTPNLNNFLLRTRGITRDVRDSQYLLNRNRIAILDIQESQINSGWKYKENALVNPKDVFMSGQGRGLALKAEAQMTDVEKIEAPTIPASMIQISEMLANEINQISGISEELLGSADDDKAGILSMIRQGAALTTLQGLFDNLDFAQKLLGKIHIQMIQQSFTPGKIQRILGEQPSEQFYNRSFGQYDAIVEEASLTSTQRQLALKQAVFLREMGVAIPSSYFIENMQIPEKDKLIKEIQATEEVQQSQAKELHDITIKQMQIDNETKLSYSDGQKALAAERMNKTRMDVAVAAERLSRAESDRAKATLDLIKAGKEIQGMDIEHLERAVAIAQTIGQDEEGGDTKAKIDDMIGQLQPMEPTKVPSSGSSEGSGSLEGFESQSGGKTSMIGQNVGQGGSIPV